MIYDRGGKRGRYLLSEISTCKQHYVRNRTVNLNSCSFDMFTGSWLKIMGDCACMRGAAKLKEKREITLRWGSVTDWFGERVADLFLDFGGELWQRLKTWGRGNSFEENYNAFHITLLTTKYFKTYKNNTVSNLFITCRSSQIMLKYTNHHSLIITR